MPASANHKLFGGMFALFLSSVTGEFILTSCLHAESMVLRLVLVAMLGMLYIIFRKYKTHSSSLLTAFSRDGAGYFLCLSGEFKFVICEKSTGRRWQPWPLQT
jgi:hypothetical protein